MRNEDALKAGHRAVIAGANFNRDASCFALAYDRGFRVYNTDPLEVWVEREFGEGGLGIATMLDRTNYLALVGGGVRPRYPANKVILWDDMQNKAVLTLEFVLPVLNVLLSREVIVAVLERQVHVYSFASPPQQLASFDTAANPNGLACLRDGILAMPGLVEGRVELVDVNKPNCPVRGLIRAHKGPLRSIALSNSLLATASVTGTLVRVYSLSSMGLLHEYRRGLDKATVWSMAFSPSGNQLAVLSDKSTLHVFVCGETVDHKENRHHALAHVPLAPRYFRDEWSSLSCQVSGHGRGLLAWTDESSIVILWKATNVWEKYVALQDSKELVREARRKIELC